MTPPPPTRAERRRRRYLDVARRLFAVHGFVGTTMDMIVAETGGSKATLYKYFSSKDALIAGLMDDVISGIGAGSAVPSLDALPLDVALTTFGRRTLAAVVSPDAIQMFRLCLGEYERFPELARVVWDHGPAVTYERFRALVAERVSRGELVVDDAQLASERFIAGLVGHIQNKVAMGVAPAPTANEIDRRVEGAVTAFVAAHGVGPKPKRGR